MESLVLLGVVDVDVFAAAVSSIVLIVDVLKLLVRKRSTLEPELDNVVSGVADFGRRFFREAGALCGRILDVLVRSVAVRSVAVRSVAVRYVAVAESVAEIGSCCFCSFILFGVRLGPDVTGLRICTEDE